MSHPGTPAANDAAEARTLDPVPADQPSRSDLHDPGIVGQGTHGRDFADVADAFCAWAKRRRAS